MEYEYIFLWISFLNCKVFKSKPNKIFLSREARNSKCYYVVPNREVYKTGIWFLVALVPSFG